MGLCSSKDNKYSSLIDGTFIGALVPDSEWKTFCELWRTEDGKTLSCKDKVCFVVVTGEVWVNLATVGRENWNRIRNYKSGDLIHLFANAELANDDGSQLLFHDLKMSFTTGKGTVVIGLTMSSFKKFVDEHPRLSALGTLLKLRMSTLIANNSYFQNISSPRINVLGPLLTLKVVRECEVLCKVGADQNGGSNEMAIIISATCLALHENKDLKTIKEKIEAQIRASEKKPVLTSVARMSDRRRSGMMERITDSMRHVGSNARVHDNNILKLEEDGEILRSGSVYGLELALLPQNYGFKDVLVTRKGVVATINPSILTALRAVDESFPKAITTNFSLNIIESLAPLVPLFGELAFEDRKALAAMVTYEKKDAGDVVFLKGDRGTKFYVLLFGTTEELEGSTVDNATPLQEYTPGDFFGEVHLVTGTPYSTTMIVKEKAMMLVFTEKTFKSIFQDNKLKAAEMNLRIAGTDLELINVLDYPPSREKFEQYLVKEMAPENLHFWVAVERLEEMCGRLDKQGQRIKAGGSAGVSFFVDTTTTTGGNVALTAERSGSDVPFARTMGSPNGTASNPPSVRYGGGGGGTGDLSARSGRFANFSGKGTDIAVGSKAYGSGMKQIREVAKSLMETYVYEGSPAQVNLPGKMRVQLEGDFNNWTESFGKSAEVIVPRELFAKAKTEAYNLMRKDTFPRWKLTDEFQQFVATIKPLPARKNSFLDANDCGRPPSTLEEKRASTLRKSWSSHLLARQQTGSIITNDEASAQQQSSALITAAISAATRATGQAVAGVPATINEEASSKTPIE